MRAPAVRATIQRRLLVNYRLDAEVTASVLPPPFRPLLVGGCGVGGVCLIRLGDIRPPGLPRRAGLTTENAAHRIAAEWDTPAGVVTGVYIPRRDTSSRLVTLLGGRAFPGWHHLADFTVCEDGSSYDIAVRSRDGRASVAVRARAAPTVMESSVFGTVEAASAFFRCAPTGYSATPTPGVFDGVELSTCGWDLRPLALEELRSSWFDDPGRFPSGSAVPDSAFLMERLESMWTAVPPVTARARR